MIRKHYVDNTNEIADEMSEGRDVEGAVPYKCVVWLFGVVVKKHKW